MKKTLEFLRTFEQTFSYVLIVLLTVLLSTQVINRYVFSTSFVWVEEIARISFVWLIYFCVASAARENRHIRVGLIDMFLPPAAIKFITYVADALVIIFNIFIVWFGVKLMISTFGYGEKTPVTNIPMALIYAVIPFCFALMVIRMLDYNIRDIFGSPTPQSDATESKSHGK